MLKKPDTFGTDPSNLTREQMIQYIIQLQQTVYHWQSRFAQLKGFKSREDWFNKNVTKTKHM